MSGETRRLARIASSTAPGEPRAMAREFSEFYEEHFDFVWRTLRYLGLHESSLDDAVQDIFLVAHRRLAEFESRSSPRTWLFGIAVHVVRAHRRGYRRRQRLLEEASRVTPPSPATPFDSVAHRDMARMLAQALESLPEPQRAVFILADLEHVTAPVIAQSFGIKLNTVYSRLRAARAHVARLLGVDVPSGEAE
jgi:RNA polymerase sigma-70 factor (ECF subfamily)